MEGIVKSVSIEEDMPGWHNNKPGPFVSASRQANGNLIGRMVPELPSPRPAPWHLLATISHGIHDICAKRLYCTKLFRTTLAMPCWAPTKPSCRSILLALFALLETETVAAEWHLAHFKRLP